MVIAELAGGNWLKYIYRSLPVFFCIIFAILAGKDLNWDALNYHAYAPFAFMEGRLEQDFYAAGPQTYLNPVGYLYFYFLISNIDSSLWVAIFLAVSHSPLIYMLFLISKKIGAEVVGEQGWKLELFALLSTVIGCSTLMFIQEIGSSFIDVYTATFNLCSLYCVISMTERNRLKMVLLSGACIGFAVAFKSVSVLFSFSLFLILLIQLDRKIKSLLWVLLFGSSAIFIYSLIAGFWFYQVYSYTGNPMFPLFNNVFCSDFYFCESFSQTRFQKEGVWEFLLWPILIALPLPRYYSELVSPDIRILVLLLFFIAALIRFRRFDFVCSKSFGLVAIFFVSSFIPWIILLGNGRYGIELFVLVGPIVTVLSYRLFPFRYYFLTSAFVLSGQIFLIILVGHFRWNTIAYSSEWYDYRVPIELEEKSFFYASIDAQTSSFLALKVHKESSFFNIMGQLTLPFNESVALKFSDFVKLHGEDNVKVITMAYKGDLDLWLEPWVDKINRKVRSVGLIVRDKSSCQLIEPIMNFDVMGVGLSRDSYVVCSAEYDLSVKLDFDRSAVKYDQVFNDIEGLCPDWVNPKSAVTEVDGRDWIRRYVGSELRLSIDKDGVIGVRFSNRILPWFIGNIDTWLIDKKKVGLCQYKYPKLFYEVFP